jgi:DNA invertase Pin-like site-specific DNA recombinase
LTHHHRSRALGYFRVSSYLGRDREDSLTEPLQLEKIQQWCAVADLDLVDVLRDVDKSGKDFDSKGRPAFDELMARLDAGEAEAVVVYRMSRFGRDFYETIRTVRRLRDRGIQFHSASERIDLESPNGRLMFNVLASFDEYELDVRREYWAETKARVMKERGVHLGRTPIGYLRASKQPKHACDVTLERAAEILRAWGSEREPVSGGLIPDPDVAPSVAKAFELRAAGAQYPVILTMLDREAPRPAGRLWSHTQVARMLSARVYLGEVGQAELVVPNAHEPLIDEATFAAAQIAPRRRPPRSPAAEFHLRGAIRCAGCGHPMVGWNQPRVRASGAVDRVRVYRCVRRRHRDACQERAVVTADGVEALVLAAFEPYVRHLTASAPTGPDRGRAAAIDAELNQIDERIRRLNGELREELDDEMWQEMLTTLARQRRDLVAERMEATAPGPSGAATCWADLDPSERFEVVRQAIGAVMVRKAQYRGQPFEERVRVYAVGVVDHLLPSRSKDFAITPFDFAAADAALSAVLGESA